MVRLEKKIGWYSILSLVPVPLIWTMAERPIAAISWAIANSIAFATAWVLMKSFEKKYRNAMIDAILEFPTPVRSDLLNFRDAIIHGIEDRLPIIKLNRWLGNYEAKLVEAGLITEEEIRDWTRPLFRPLDFGIKA